ncbi:Pentatricopeptide repeat-containing protein, partial [Thalictrum thalictroides]
EFNEARRVFDEIPQRDVVAWTGMISGYTTCGRHSEAWVTFCEMKKEDVELTAYPISSVLKACKGMRSCFCGGMVHGLAVKCGVTHSIYVENALMDMYATCSGDMDDACKEEMELNPFTLSITIRACSTIASHIFGQQIHASVIKHGFESNLPVGNSLVDMYCRCSRLSEAYRYFHELPDRDLITWNTMIAGFEKSGSDLSLQLFSQLCSEDLCPNCFTFTSVAASCANLAALTCGQQIHGGIIRRGLESNFALTNALLDMYAKCGSIAESHRIFSEMPWKDVISWTSMMNAYGSHGYGKEAIGLFYEMVHSGVKPDRIVFMGVISACSHAGLVDEGLKYFNSMDIDYSVKPNQEIYGCVVDLLGRAGRLLEAYELTISMPFEPDEMVWGALLGACREHKNSTLGQLAAQKILNMRPSGAETYVTISNMYAVDGRWGEFAEMRKLMRGAGDKKVAGRSWIEVRNQVCSFVVGEKVGPNIELVYNELKTLVQQMKDVGYVPDSDCFIHDFEAVV